MRRKITQRISTILLSLAMVFSCLFVLVSCGKKDNDVASLSIELVSDEYTLKDDTISVTYGNKVELDAEDFKVSAVYEDDSKTELSLASGEVEGFSFKSTLPSDEKTPAGEYKLTFEYDEVSAEVKVKVNKAVIEVSDVSWNYDEPFTYNKEEQKVELVGLPEGVTATYKNNTAINHGDYVASAELSYVDSDNYVVAPVEDLSWTINKADIDMSTVGTSGPFKYSGTLKSSALYGLPQGVYASLASGANMATDVRAEGYTVEYSFEYLGEDAENYNPIPNKTFTWMINKADFTSNFVDIDDFRYTGSEQTIAINNIHTPTGVTVKEISGTTSLTEVGKATITLTLEFAGKALNNFNTVETIDVEWEIQKANFDMSGVSWDYSGAFTYDGTEKSIAIKGTLPSGLSVNEYSNNTAVNAGTHTASVSFTFDEAHYNNPNFASCTWVINKKTLTIKANDHAIVYLDAASNNGVSYSGFVDGQNETNVLPTAGELVYRYGAYVVGGGVSTYSISISASTLVYQNYTVSYQTGTLTVNPKPIDMQSVAWDYTSPYTYSGLVQKPMLNNVSEYVGVIYKYKVKNAESESEPIAAGTYVATAEFRTSNNFTLVNNNIGTCEFIIQKKVVTVTANNKTINFGDAPTHANVSYLGFVTGESQTNVGISGDVVYTYGTYVAGADVGEYVIDISTSTLEADNYNFNYVAGKLVVVPIEIDMANVSWNYSEAYTYTGVKQEPKLANLPTGVDVTYTYKLGDVETEPINAGTYNATATFETSKNYTIVNNNLQPLTFEIQKAVVTVTANAAEIDFYDEPTNKGVTYAGFVNGETHGSVIVIDGEHKINYTYATYEKGDSAGTYENEILISTSTLEAQNYTFTYVAGDLVVKTKDIDLSGLTWNYDAGTPFVYDGTAKRPTLVGTIPEYVEYEYVYTLNDVEADPINAGEYVATIVFAEPEVASYIVNEPAEVQIEFTIEKATIDDEKLGFNVGGGAETASAVYTGEEHHIAFINNTGLELDIHWVASNPENLIPTYIGTYEFECFVSLNEDDAQNYELEKDHYILTYKVKDFIENYTATINNGTESTKVNYYRTFEQQDYYDFNLPDVVLENIEVDFAEGAEGYTYKLFTDVALSTEVDFSNINHFENRKIFAVIYKGDEIFDVRTIDNIYLKYVVLIEGDDVQNIEQNATSVQVNVDYSPISIDTTSSNLTFQLPDADGFVTNIYIATADAQGVYGKYGDLDEFGNSTIAISGSDIVSAKMRLEYVVGEKSYSYVKYFSIVPNVNTDELFTLTYTSASTDGYETTASENSLSIDANVNNVDELDLSTIEIDMTNDDYQEVEDSREIVESNGNFYLKVVLEEKIAQESSEIALYAQANQIVCYIKLYVDGTVDDNVMVVIYGGYVDYSHKAISISQDKSLSIEAMNSFAKIEIYTSSMALVETFVGRINGYYFESVGQYEIKITATDGKTFANYTLTVSPAEGSEPEHEYYDYADMHYVEDLVMSFEVNGVEYSTVKGDFYFESELPEYYVRLEDNMADVVSKETGMVAILKFVAQGFDFNLYDMTGTELVEESFALTPSIHNIFGYALMFRGVVAGGDSATFAIVFKDSMPESAQLQYTTEKPEGISLSVTLTDSNSENEKTYSIENGDFYYCGLGAQYGYHELYARIDFERSELEFDYGEDYITGWYSFKNLSISLAGATFLGFDHSGGQSFSQDKKGFLTEYEDFGWLIEFDAMFVGADSEEITICVNLVFEDSIPTPHEFEEGENVLITMTHANGSLYSAIGNQAMQFDGDFEVDMNTASQSSLTFIAYAGNILEENQNLFTFTQINISSMFFGSLYEVKDANNNSLVINVVDGVAQNVGLIINKTTNSVSIIITTHSPDSDEPLMTFIFVIYFTQNPNGDSSDDESYGEGYMGVMMHSCDENWFEWNIEGKEISATRSQLGMDFTDFSATVTLVYTVPQSGYKYSVINGMENYEAIVTDADVDDYVEHVDTYYNMADTDCYVLEIMLNFDMEGKAYIFICDPTIYSMIGQTIEGGVGAGDSEPHTITLIDCYIPIVITVSDFIV